ncbi:MAG: carbohydrate ABC transporter permease [Spirochaetaceae bacterium]|jgi:putative aldouronate transport system permease protein|uniref:Carbohydrate ABC transporter permease n=1 Tax=Sphaerochaeta halotolerans TaxID=2293840 RepID=A0A372MDX3_9SPIR|nr:carbohydrate ABC transporter permease [Sphaerochaeta halotolerans]MBG0767113.1 carbohydrate ABC transporter permease [Spirochaetaceae bacterium]RFU93989.1 carbohydrate ABC transporter permease [Sphaerochaeta halotolerans]
MKPRLIRKDQLPIPIRAFNILMLLLVVVLMGLPMLNVLSVSLSTQAKSDSPGMVLWPNPPTFEGYQFIWKYTNLATPFFNTVYVSVVGTVLHVILASLAGYILCQPNLPLKKGMTTFVLLTMTVPYELTMIGIYAVNKDLGLINTYTGLIVNGMISGFSVFLMRNYFQAIPQSLAESARIDGASELRIFSAIYLRLALSGLLTIGTLELIRRWNNITMTVTLISDMKKWTLPVVLRFILFDQTSTSGTSYIFANAKMAAVVLTALPLIVLYFFTQSFFSSGIMIGSIKE